METMDADKRKELQFERLKETVARCAKLPFYLEKFKEAGFRPSDLKSFDDLAKIPFTVKDDLRKTYPFGMFTSPLSEIVELHASSGTTGKPIVVGYTQKDIDDVWSEVMARAYTAAGVTSDDVVQNSYGYGLFTGGFGFHYGAMKTGATVVPISTGNTKRQLMLMQDFGTTIMCCTPSYSLYIADSIKKMGINRSDLKIRVGFFGAEPWSEEMRKEIEKRLEIEAFDMYGLSEIIGPGVAAECSEHDGLHVFDDHFIVEVIDSDTGEVLPAGEEGELVFTTITKQGFPVLRYRTKDISKLFVEKCKCGRTHPRMQRVSGRSDDMLIIRGINVFPSQIESVILEIPGLAPFYQIEVDRINNLDVMGVQVEATREAWSTGKQEELTKKLSAELVSVLQIKASVKIVEPESLPRTEGKAKHVADKRK